MTTILRHKDKSMILSNKELKNKVIEIFKQAANQFIIKIENAVNSGKLKYKEFEEVVWRDLATLEAYPIIKVDGFDILITCIQNNPEDYYEDLYKPHLQDYYTIHTQLKKSCPDGDIIKLNFNVKPIKEFQFTQNTFMYESEKEQIFHGYYVYIQTYGSDLDVIQINDIDEKFEMFKLIKRIAETYKYCKEKVLLTELN